MRRAIVLLAGALLSSCGGSSSSSAMPSQATPARVRFADGAPELEALVGSTPQSICSSASNPCYLQVNGQTVTSLFSYGSMTSFANVTSGPLSLVARDTLGYAVGPLTTAPLTGGQRYTLVVVGSYPAYRVLTFAEPASDGAQLSLYEASPAVPQAAFGRFVASSHSGFDELGSARLGTVVTVRLGKRVTDFGGYAGPSDDPIGALTLKAVNAFDTHDVLPFHAAGRLSLFLFDPKSGSTSGPLFGSLDR